MNFKSRIGLIRSLLIYNYKPFNKRRLLNFYSQFIEKGDLAFDIGAHTGNRSMSWLSIGAKVVAIEPQPILAGYMEKKIGANSDFILLKKVLGKDCGTVNFRINEAHPSVSTISDEWTNILKEFKSDLSWDSSIEVEMITLGNLIKSYGVPVFCKIDVEGFEHEVLAGLSHPIPNISFEFFPTTLNRTFDCLEKIISLGTYTFNWVLAETFKYQSEKWLSIDEIKEQMSNYNGKKPGDIYCKLVLD